MDTEVEVPPIPDRTARGVSTCVVAVKWPGQWILRAIGPFRTPDSLAAALAPYLATVPEDAPLEWSTHTYHQPGYMVYGAGDIKPSGWPEAGVFLFRHLADNHYPEAKYVGALP